MQAKGIKIISQYLDVVIFLLTIYSDKAFMRKLKRANKNSNLLYKQRLQFRSFIWI